MLLSLSPNGAPITLSAKQDGQVDLEAALDNLFSHSNVGPFIGKQLIQHLVTSNPSPAYINRVSTAFNTGRSNGFGTGNRGDMQALIAAILLDIDARGALKTEVNYGHLREPAQFVLNILRTSNAQSDGILNQLTTLMSQDIFNSPTVFNYYPHSYMIPGTLVDGPEFGIDTSIAAIARENFINSLVFSKINVTGSVGTSINFSQLNTLAANPLDLINTLDQVFLHSTMDQNMRTQLLTIINSISAKNPLLRSQTAVYLILTSNQYQVQR
jgi:hypothetical protein